MCRAVPSPGSGVGCDLVLGGRAIVELERVESSGRLVVGRADRGVNRCERGGEGLENGVSWIRS